MAKKEKSLTDIVHNYYRCGYRKAHIYFHQDLDGVTTALAMKQLLKNYGIETTRAIWIQYGHRNYAIQAMEKDNQTLNILVDFAQGKPSYDLHIDHHESQVGVGKDSDTEFIVAPSNLASVNQELTRNHPHFSSYEVKIVSIIDSADFYRNKLTPQDVMKYHFSFNRNLSYKDNIINLGISVNKIILAVKRKNTKKQNNILEELVMRCKPNLKSIWVFLNYFIYHNKNLCNIDEMNENKKIYLKSRVETYFKNSNDLYVEDNIAVQKNMGDVFAQGSYDRYMNFRVLNCCGISVDFYNPRWYNLGLTQFSMNPFKKKSYINLNEVKNQVLEEYKEELKSYHIPLAFLKKKQEEDVLAWKTEKGIEGSLGYTFHDFLSQYSLKQIINYNRRDYHLLKNAFNNPFKKIYSSYITKFGNTRYNKNYYLSPNCLELLNKLKIPLYDIIVNESGGHQSITNISGFRFIPYQMLYIETKNGEKDLRSLSYEEVYPRNKNINKHISEFNKQFSSIYNVYNKEPLVKNFEKDNEQLLEEISQSFLDKLKKLKYEKTP